MRKDTSIPKNNQNQKTMAKINNGHFGSYQGKLGAVTGRKMRGQFYIHQSITHNSSNTVPQQKVRAKFKCLSHFCGQFERLFKTTMVKARRGQETPYNAGARLNWQAVKPAQQDPTTGAWTAVMDPDKLLFSAGNYQPVKSLVYDENTSTTLKFSWDDEIGEGSALDFVNILVYCPKYEEYVIVYRDASVTRSESECSISIPTSWMSQDLYGYGWAESPEGRKIGETQYLGIIQPD